MNKVEWFSFKDNIPNTNQKIFIKLQGCAVHTGVYYRSCGFDYFSSDICPPLRLEFLNDGFWSPIIIPEFVDPKKKLFLEVGKVYKSRMGSDIIAIFSTNNHLGCVSLSSGLFKSYNLSYNGKYHVDDLIDNYDLVSLSETQFPDLEIFLKSRGK